jgi:predicted enzyme related to lactoylglutathione lyase
MGCPVVHWEFWSEDPSKIGEFYRDVFDWDIRHVPELDYHVVASGGKGGIGGGIMKPKQGPWPAKLSMYIQVEDLDAIGRKIRGAGGKLLMEGMDVPGVGTFSLFEDPDGRVLGIWKQTQPEG